MKIEIIKSSGTMKCRHADCEEKPEFLRYSSSSSVSIPCEGTHTDSEEEFQHLLSESKLLINLLGHLSLILELLFLQKGRNLILRLKIKRSTRGIERRSESREFPNPNLPSSLRNLQRNTRSPEPRNTRSTQLATDLAPLLQP